MENKINIAIDGHSSCGKSTIAKVISYRFGMRYIDTGAMYRSITLYCIQNDIITNSEVNREKLLLHLEKISVSFNFNTELEESETTLNGVNVDSEIRKHYVSEKVSTISQIKQVREKLIILQQEIGKKKGVVMDGRDIGTRVLHDAEIKFFITADAEIRAKRRYNEMNKSKVSFQDILKNLLERDEKDSNRDINPLRVADDAIVIDNSNLSHQEQNDFIFKIIKKKIESND